MYPLSWNLEASTSWNPQGLSSPVIGLLYLFLFYLAQYHLNVWPPSPETIRLPNTWNRYFWHAVPLLRHNSFVQPWFRQAHRLYERSNCKNLTDRWKRKEWDKKLNWHKTFKNIVKRLVSIRFDHKTSVFPVAQQLEELWWQLAT